MIEFVIRASNILKVDELQLFYLAYEFWHAREAEPRHIRKVFSRYMDKKIAPPWVVHFARSVLRDYQCSNFNPAKFGVRPRPEALPLLRSLIFKTSRTLPLHDDNNVFIA